MQRAFAFSLLAVLIAAVGVAWATEPAPPTEELEIALAPNSVGTGEDASEADREVADQLFTEPAYLGACCAVSCRSERTACKQACAFGDVPCLDACQQAYLQCMENC